MTTTNSTGPQRDGDLLVLTEEQTLPPRCPLCNAPAPGAPLSVNFASPRKKNLAAQLTSMAVDRMRGWNYTGPVVIQIPFCEQHAGRRKTAYAICGGLLLAGLITAAILRGVGYQDGTLAVGIVPAGLGLFGLLFISSGALNLWMSAKRFDDRRVWLKGASPAYLESLPQVR